MQEKVNKIGEVVEKYKSSGCLLTNFLNKKRDIVDMIHDTLTYYDLLEIKKKKRLRKRSDAEYNVPYKVDTAS